MILHSDRYFEHEYDVKWDLLNIKWPSIESLYLPEIMHSISKLVENVKNYNIRNLLIDASEAELRASYLEADEVVRTFTAGLAGSRLEKLARIESQNVNRENMLRQMAIEMNRMYPYEIRFFREENAARLWLQNGYDL